MTKRTLFTFTVSLLLAAAGFAADVTGKWTAQVPSRNGETRETTFALKADGATLTGTVTTMQGEAPIMEGKVDGDKISFVVESQRGKQNYSGAVAGDEIKFKREGGQGQPREFTAKRAK